MVSEKDAKGLAVCYEAYCEARNSGRDRSLRVWAGQLMRLQDATAIELVNRATLASLTDGLSAFERAELGIVRPAPLGELLVCAEHGGDIHTCTRGCASTATCVARSPASPQAPAWRVTAPRIVRGKSEAGG